MEPEPVADGPSFPSKELGSFDVTVANILAGPLVRLQPVLARFTRPGTYRYVICPSDFVLPLMQSAKTIMVS